MSVVYYTATTVSSSYGFSTAPTYASSGISSMGVLPSAPLVIPSSTSTGHTQATTDTRMIWMMTKTVTSMAGETVTQAAAVNASSSIMPNDHFVAVTVGIIAPLSLIVVAVALCWIWSWRKDKLRHAESTMKTDLVAYDYTWLEEVKGEWTAQSPIVVEAGDKTPIVEAGGAPRAELADASPRFTGLLRTQYGRPHRPHR